MVNVSVSCSAEALRSDGAGAEPAVPRSVPVRVAYELQQAGHRYLDVRYGTTGTAQPLLDRRRVERYHIYRHTDTVQ